MADLSAADAATQKAKAKSLKWMRALIVCNLFGCLMSAIDQNIPWYAVGSIILILCVSGVMYVCIDLLLERLKSYDLMCELRMAFTFQTLGFIGTVNATLDIIGHYPVVTGGHKFSVAALFLSIIILAGSTLAVVTIIRHVLRKLKTEREGLTSPSCHAESFGKMLT